MLLPVQNFPNNFCWFRLKNFPVDIFQSQNLEKYLNKPVSWIFTIRPEEFHISIHNWLKENDLCLNGGVVFFRRNLSDDCVLHVDHDDPLNGNERFRSSAINVELLGSSTMNFYSGDAHSGNLKITPTNQPYYDFPHITYENLIDSCSFDSNATLVRTDVIHGVKCRQVPRLVVSLRFSNLDGSRLTWAESVERLSVHLNPR